jgi:hypothetical protein
MFNVERYCVRVAFGTRLFRTRIIALYSKKYDNTGLPKRQQHLYKDQLNLSYVPLYLLMPCICRRTSVRGHRIQRYFSPLTTRATFSPERLLSPPPGALRKTFPLIESVSEAIAKEGRESAICSQLGISEVEHSNIQVCSCLFLRCDLFYIPDRTSCMISSTTT